MTYLPQTNEPGCSAGFAHGLVTGVAPQIDLGDPLASASVCDESDTRYRRYSCIHGFGHAFMRLVREDLTQALELCGELGADAADCSQGAFHDYWFAAIGADDTEPPENLIDDPRELCGAHAGDLLPGGLRAVHTPGPEEVHFSFLLEGDPRVLFCSDLLTNYGGRGLDFVPLKYHDDPPQTRRTVEGFLNLDFDVLCLDHGSAIAADPKAEIRALLARAASA